MDDEDLEMLRQAALRTLGSNKNKKEGTGQARLNASSRVKTNGNLIEIQPSDDVADLNSREGLTSEEYVVEEFVLDGSDVSINSSDCDEVIEEVIVSDPEDVEDVVPVSKELTNRPNREQKPERSPSRSLSSRQQNSSEDDDESDAVSIKSSYSLIMDDDEEFQSVEAKFLSRKMQKQKPLVESTPSGNDESISRRRKSRSRSPQSLPFRTFKNLRRSRSRDINRSTNRKSRSRSRSPHPGRRRNHSPPAGRGSRRAYRTNSNDRNPRRRRTRSRSPNARLSSPTTRNRLAPANQNIHNPKSRSKSPIPKQRPNNSQSGAPRPPQEEKLPEKLQKTVKNNHIPPEHLDRLEKRRKKFEEDPGVVASKKKVIKITSANKEKQSPTTSDSPKSGTPSGKASTKEKVHKTAKRSVELVLERDLAPAKHIEKSGHRHNDDSKEKSVSGSGDNQEDLRARLIKKKMEKQMQQGSGSGSSSSSNSNGTLSSVVVPVNNKGSHRIFSQALKNSQLLDPTSELSNSSKGSTSKTSSRSKSPSSSSASGTPIRTHKPKSEVTLNRNSSSSSNKKTSGSSRNATSSASSISSSSSKNRSGSSSSGTKRVVSVTYS